LVLLSHYLSGTVRIPVHYEVYRRYEDVTEWEHLMGLYFLDEAISKTAKEKVKLNKQYDSLLMNDPKFKALHEESWSKILITKTLLEQAIESHILFK
jgi:hypothetical protein